MVRHSVLFMWRSTEAVILGHHGLPSDSSCTRLVCPPPASNTLLIALDPAPYSHAAGMTQHVNYVDESEAHFRAS